MMFDSIFIRKNQRNLMKKRNFGQYNQGLYPKRPDADLYVCC